MVDKKYITRDMFYANHVLCPKCKTMDNVKASNIYIVRSEARDFVDKLNTAYCENCGWKGQRIDLLKPIGELA